MSGFRIRRLSRTSGRRKCACATATATSSFVVIAIFTLSAFNLRQNRFSLNDFQAHLGDDIAVSRFANDLSATFCSEYEIEMWDRNEVYLLPRTAEADPTVHRLELFQIRYVPWVFLLDSREFYLLYNSTVHLTGCNAVLDPAWQGAEMVLYRGHVESHHRHRRGEQEDNELLRVPIPPQAICNASAPLPELRYTVREEGNYYVVVYEREHGDDDGNFATITDRQHHNRAEAVLVNGTLMRTGYDVRAAKEVCRDHFLCRFSLDFAADGAADIVLRIQGSPVTPLAPTSFSTHCHPRVLFWVAVFGGAPLLLVLTTIAFWVWFYCVRLPALDAKRCICKVHGCANGSDSGVRDRHSRRLSDESRPLLSESDYGAIQ